jgi:hypothetical protein
MVAFMRASTARKLAKEALACLTQSVGSLCARLLNIVEEVGAGVVLKRIGKREGIVLVARVGGRVLVGFRVTIG